MYKFHKQNKKTGIKKHLQSSQMQYSPFTFGDTKYLEHLHQQIKLRNSRDASVQLRKDWMESNQRKNYQNELDRIKGELTRPNLPFSTKEALEERVKQLKNLVFS